MDWQCQTWFVRKETIPFLVLWWRYLVAGVLEEVVYDFEECLEAENAFDFGE